MPHGLLLRLRKQIDPEFLRIADPMESNKFVMFRSACSWPEHFTLLPVSQKVASQSPSKNFKGYLRTSRKGFLSCLLSKLSLDSVWSC
jgi:hypothetical protein